ncbi:MAG: hypothetical protein Q7R43_02460 [Candidatus Daviesbacteria bacterium]|nr:hypothetical protein [Candidatus Daviesbacteria bacterium]
MKKIKDNFKLLLIPLICSVIIFSWFYEGKIIANTSEEELNLYHAQKTAEDDSSYWYPPGIGRKAPFQFARFPAFHILGWFENMGMPAFLRQALLLWVLMVVGVSGMYFLLKRVFGISSWFSLIGSFFYLLNIYSMTQVWKRFLYHGIFSWTYLPLFLFLWIKWIDSKRIIWLFLFLLTSVFFSYTFSQPAFLITIWAPAGIFALVRTWQFRLRVNEAITTFLRSVIGFILWCLVNLWWLYPMLTLGSTWNETSGQTWESDFGSLQAVSKSFPIWEVLLLRQSWYLSSTNDFGSFYQNPIILLISVLVLYFVARAVVKLKEYKYRGFVLILAFVGLFISKGTSFPFGYTFFYLLFSNFNFTTAFRNSYEKFGIVYLLAYTILFTLGFSNFLSSLKLNRRFFIGGGMLFLILILILPFWSGSLFPQKHRVYVPKYYDEANTYLIQQSTDRLFHIPFTLELENSIYSWGYTGGDPAYNLFDLESTTNPKLAIYYNVFESLPKYLNNKQFPKILGLLGVENVILHKDILFPKINIEETIKNIEGWEGVKQKKEFGELIIYRLNKELVRSRFYIATSVISVKSIQDGLTQTISNTTDTSRPVFIAGKMPDIAAAQFKNLPKITFSKISNDHFFVKVRDATEPYILIFNNTFDKSWQLRVENKIIEQFIVNGFANGWLVDKEGDYKLDIKLKVWPWD